MAQRQFLVRGAKLVNRAHLDHEYPYRYGCDPHRYEARERDKYHKHLTKLEIQVGLDEYYAPDSDKLS